MGLALRNTETEVQMCAQKTGEQWTRGAFAGQQTFRLKLATEHCMYDMRKSEKVLLTETLPDPNPVQVQDCSLFGQQHISIGKTVRIPPAHCLTQWHLTTAQIFSCVKRCEVFKKCKPVGRHAI